ncbi:MAG: carbon monoxide dehydrogenase subunit G [Halovenus sp.]
MKFDGEFVVDGAPEEIWPYFNDPDILQDCAPGCKEMVLESPSQLRATLEVGVGSVKPTFDVDAVVLECTEPSRLEIRATGEASRNSFSMTAWQELTDNGDGTTTVEWEADADVSGVIASLGDRALGSVTNKLVNDFFQDLEDHVNAGTPAEAKLEAAGEEELEAAAEAAASHDGDVIDDLFALLGSVRGGGDAESAAASSNVAVSLAAGAVGGVAGALVWSRLRSGDGAAAPAADSDEMPAGGDGGGRLRYLLVGVVLGAVGTFLWNQYAGATEERPDDEQTTGNDRGTDRGSDGAAVGTEAEREPAPGGDGTEPERGLIDDPLDRLN